MLYSTYGKICSAKITAVILIDSRKLSFKNERIL